MGFIYLSEREYYEGGICIDGVDIPECGNAIKINGHDVKNIHDLSDGQAKRFKKMAEEDFNQNVVASKSSSHSSFLSEQETRIWKEGGVWYGFYISSNKYDDNLNLKTFSNFTNAWNYLLT